MLALLSLLGACTVTPEPLGKAEQAARTKSDLEALRSIEFVPTEPITLHEAMARAVSFNLKRRVSQIERNIAEAELEQSSYEMLPTLELNAGKTRNDVQISSSDDRITKTADASFTWNLLDLGVSYARAKQRADEVLIAREKERKALQDIIRQVNTAFWRAATGERLMKKVSALSRDLRLAMAASRRMEDSRATDVISAVSFRREVVESVRQALTVQRELSEAKAELAELLNIRPGTKFSLVVPPEKVSDFRLPMSVPEMEEYALLSRPELRIEDYNERKSDWEAREAIYDMLPGLDLSVGRNYSSESSNLSPNWISTGLNLGMNIFNLFSGTSEVEAAEHRGELARQQRLAMSLAVLTQLHLARVKFQNARQQMQLVKQIADSDRHLARLVATDGTFLNKDFFEAVRLATRQMTSEMDEQRTFVDLVSSHAEVMHAIGQNALPEEIPLNNIPVLASAIREMTATWFSRGENERQTAELAQDGSVDRLVEAMLPPGDSVPAPAMAVDEARPETEAADEPTLEFADVDNEAGTGPVAESREDASSPMTVTGAQAKDEYIPDLEIDNSHELNAEDAPHAAEDADAGSEPDKPVATVEEPGRVTEVDGGFDATRPEIAKALNDIAPASRGDAHRRSASTEWELSPGSTFPSNGDASPGATGLDAPHAERFIVSLGAFRQQENAFGLHAKLGSDETSLFGTTAVRVVLRSAEDGRTYYFVQTDPMPDRRTALSLCRSLKRAGRACYVSALAD